MNISKDKSYQNLSQVLPYTLHCMIKIYQNKRTTKTLIFKIYVYGKFSYTFLILKCKSKYNLFGMTK